MIQTPSKPSIAFIKSGGVGKKLPNAQNLVAHCVSVVLLTFCSFANADATKSSVSTTPDGGVVIERAESEVADFRVVKLVSGLKNPWAVDWLPDGRTLITERSGNLYLIDGKQVISLSNVPTVWAENQGGLLDLAVAPDFKDTGWIYLTYSARENGKGGTILSRARIKGSQLTDVEELYRQTPFLTPNYHFGSRIVFMNDGTLLVTLGERGQRREKKVDIPTPSTSVGATVRLNRDGSVPADNPFVDVERALPEVYSYGHRNPQGMAIHPQNGDIRQHEHGPRGGDELNLVEAGNNYGWPAVSYGKTYRGQKPIGVTSAPGITSPVEYWDPSPAFSGMAFYTGNAFPNWKNNLFMGALAQQKLFRLELGEDKTVTHQEELLSSEIGRIRDVAVGPGGYLYLLTDMTDGGLYRLEPVE